MGVIFRPENKHQPRHHEPTVRGLDTHSQSVIQEGMSKDTEQYVRSYQSRRQSWRQSWRQSLRQSWRQSWRQTWRQSWRQSWKQSRKLETKRETKRRTADHNIEEETQYEMFEAAMDEGNLFYSISMLPKIAELILLNTLPISLPVMCNKRYSSNL